MIEGAQGAMNRELTFELPYARLLKLGRSMNRKAFSGIWWGKWALIGGYIVTLIGLSYYGLSLDIWLTAKGFPFGTDILFFVSIVLFVLGFIWLRRLNIRAVKERVNFSQMIRLRKDDDGLRIATDDIEYYLKWHGISQMLMEKDGVVVSHGTLFFLIPDAAFHDKAERQSFIRDIYGRLSDEARKRSENRIAPVLGYI